MIHVSFFPRSRYCLLAGVWLLTALPASGAQRPPAPTRVPLPRAVATRYAELDRIARDLPDHRAGSVPLLAASLGARARTNDEKARLLFAWLACHVAYDAEALRPGARPSDSIPAAVLQRRRGVCQGYADLFTAVARQMKLPARTVKGFGRTSRARSGGAANHAWNVYQANDGWHLVDATWGAGSVDNYRFARSFSPFWFDVAPAKFIFSHLPEDSAWQLLPRALSCAEFGQLPYAPAALLQLGPWEEKLPTWTAGTPQATMSALPTAFDADVAVQIEQVPLWAELPRRQPVVFRFSVPPGVELNVEANGRYTVLEGRGSSRQTTVTPVSGNVTVWVGPAAGSTGSSRVALLQYRVPAVVPLRVARWQAAPADTVAYLRR